MNFSATDAKTFAAGDLFLGLDENNREIGLQTNRHAITVAGARSGKGACAIIPNLLRWPHNVLVVDPKGENAIKTWKERMDMGKSVHVLDPFISDDIPDQIRASFNPMESVDPKSLRAGSDLKVIADGLVKRHDAKHAQWDNGAVSLLAGIMAFVIDRAPKEERNLLEVRRILMHGRDDLYEVAQNMKDYEGCDRLAVTAGTILMTAIESEKGMEKDYLARAREETEWLGYDAFQPVISKSTFSLSDLKTGNASVYVVLPPEYLKEHASFLRLFVRCAINAMAGGGSGKGEKCLFILDEFFALGKIDEISSSCGLMPSYGVHLWPFLQDLGQLFTVYGHDGAETFFANADLHQFFGNTDKLTLEYMSKMTGEVTATEIGKAPNAPINMGGGQSMIAAASAHSKVASTRAAGAVWGAMSSGLSSAISGMEQAAHQNEMNEYQQKMAGLGRPRLTSEEIAKLVQRKTDDVADNLFCITYGSDKFTVKPAPYFRPTPQPTIVEDQSGLGFWARAEAWLKAYTEKEKNKPVVVWKKTLENSVGGFFIGTVALSNNAMNIMPVEDAMGTSLIVAPMIAYVFARDKKKKQDAALLEVPDVVVDAEIKPAPLPLIDKVEEKPLMPFLDEVIKEHLKAGSDINAIKEYRTRTGCDFKEAQAAIKKFRAELST